MKVFVTGGTGFVGRSLVERLIKEGHVGAVLSRRTPGRGDSKAALKLIKGDPTERGSWQAEAAEHEVFINLAGASIFTRWTPERKRLFRDSRILTTRNLVEAIQPQSGTILFSTSAVGYYGFHGDEELNESSPPGDDFLANLSRDWEAEATKAEDKGARVVITRFGIVLGPDGGALQQMANAFKRFVGGPLGSGLQWLSWIHREDLVGAFVHILADARLSGPFNFTAPYPMQNKDFSRTLGKVLGRPSWMPAPEFMVKLALGEFGSVILKGQRVLPKRLQQSGFTFQWPELEDALQDLLG
jgi:uncharacterized protein (TIGR01777 family)